MRSLLATLCAATLAATLPAVAGASSRQFTIMQDDAVFLGVAAGEDPDAAMAEAKALGVDVVRVFINWQSVSPAPRSQERPPGFDISNPDSPGYDWGLYDGLVMRAKKHDMKLYMTLSPPLPPWASDEPRGCPHRTAGNATLPFSCHWKPRVDLFGQFAAAAAKRYGQSSTGPFGGYVELWSIWNEPNLEHYLFPQFERREGMLVDAAARRYRRLWIAGQRAIAKFDPAKAGKVLFGETAAISSPLDTLYAALCLDERGQPLRGARRRLQGCGAPGKLPIGGIAVHPYNGHASGSVFTRSRTSDSLPPAYLNRLRTVMRNAERHGRIPPGSGIFLTEAGFQTNPPDLVHGLAPRRHARVLNEAERLYWGDRRIRSIAQFELVDVPTAAVEPADADVYTTGLRYLDGSRKPAWGAFRMPLVVSRLGAANKVEVWGAARAAQTPSFVSIESSPRRGAPFRLVAAAKTNSRGYYRIVLSRPGARTLRYRASWASPLGGRMFSRVARAGFPIRYMDERPERPTTRERSEPRERPDRRKPRKRPGRFEL